MSLTLTTSYAPYATQAATSALAPVPPAPTATYAMSATSAARAPSPAPPRVLYSPPATTNQGTVDTSSAPVDQPTNVSVGPTSQDATNSAPGIQPVALHHASTGALLMGAAVLALVGGGVYAVTRKKSRGVSGFFGRSRGRRKRHR